MNGHADDKPRPWERDLKGVVDQAKLVALRQRVVHARRSRRLVLALVVVAAAVLTVVGIAMARSGGKLTQDEGALLAAIVAVGLAVWTFLEPALPSVSHSEADEIAGKRIASVNYEDIKADAETSVTRWTPLLAAAVLFVFAALGFATA